MRRVSLHVGLSFVDPDAYGGWSGNLGMPPTWDAVRLGELFAQGGFEATIWTYKSPQKPTLAAVVGELDLLSNELVAGDAFVFTYSGHGDNQPTESLCLYDGELSDSKLHNLLAQFKPGVRVVVILDSCFSGGMDRAGVGRTMGRAKPVGVIVNRIARVDRTVPLNAAVVQFDACRAEETAGQDDKGGFFSSGLVETFQTGFSWRKWDDLAAAATTARDPFQHPIVHEMGAQTIMPADAMTFALSDTPPQDDGGMPTNPGPSQAA